MSARDLIEAEGPKEFLRQHAPPKKIYLVCPVQGKEEDYDSGKYSVVVINGGNAQGKLPDHLKQLQGWWEDPTYEWDDFYVYEILDYCRRTGIEVFEAWAEYPDDGIMVDAYMDYMNQQDQRRQEAEDPKSVFRAARNKAVGDMGLEPGHVWLYPYEEGESPVALKKEEVEALAKLNMAEQLGDFEWSVPGCFDWEEVEQELQAMRSETAANAWIGRLHQEAEDPKSFLRRASSDKIWPSENYYINIWKPEENWKDGEFCPAQINDKNELMQFDALYGIVDEIYAAMGVEGDPSAAEEQQFEQEYDKYGVPIYDSVKKGITSGTLDGILGPRNWQIVYAPPSDDRQAFDSWISGIVPVRPGEQYGERITPENDRSTWPQFQARQEAADLVDALLEVEDPKALMKANFGRPQGTYVIVTQWIDPHYPKSEDVYEYEDEALENFRKLYLNKRGGGEWYMTLLFRPDKNLNQPRLPTKRILHTTYDRGDDQLRNELKSGAPVLQAFKNYEARTKLASAIHREAYRRFPNTGEVEKHYLSGNMVAKQTNDDWFKRDDFFREQWRQRSGHPPDCQCYHCRDLQRPTAREYMADQERRKAEAYKRWKRAVYRAKAKGLPPPPEPRNTNYMRGPYDY